MTDIVNQTIINYWKSCNGVRKVTELADWVSFAGDKDLTDEQIEEEIVNEYTGSKNTKIKGLTDEQIEEGKDIIGN